MTPVPQEHASVQHDGVSDLDGDSIVISGMSGIYPRSNNVNDLSKILYDKINPIVTDHSRWTMSHPEVIPALGAAPRLDRFDAQFFKVHFRLGNHMDVMARKILEMAYEAIYDAGVTSEQLTDKCIGVYTASFYSESEVSTLNDVNSKSGFSLTGTSRTMFANRISYWLNGRGPSMAIDGECCGSLVALERACLAIKKGECDAAIVGGNHICWQPQSIVHKGRMMSLCKDGKTKSFDQNADGCVPSEAINILFLQKAKDAVRIYAEVVHVKTEFGSVLEGDKYGYQRNPKHVAEFLRCFYDEAKISADQVDYVEAFGCAGQEADKAELEALDEVFCKNRVNPLLVGSVMSNIGNCDNAAGISAITKVLLGYQTGKLAGNLHCENPRQDVAALREGRMRILTDHQEIDRSSYTAVNGISIAGVNAHVLLRGYSKPKDTTRYKASIPRLVAVSGRQESSVQKIIDNLKSRPVDPEELFLLHNIHELKITGHMARGYSILDTVDGNTVCISEKADYFPDTKRPLWFVYSGMGSQWASMGANLMRIPIFAAAIERCRRVLEPKGLDIVHIITSPDRTIYDNILHSFVGIAAVQIGLTDILNELGLEPDKIIGHSVGELGCAYGDGCLSAEEMILAAYYRGLVSIETPFIRGSMAAVGIGYEEVTKLCPPEIEVACHNSPGSSTISGPAEVMKEFVGTLVAKGIFAKEVPCSNIAYHSRYIAEAGPKLLEHLGNVIKNPKQRSERWLSTSVPMDKWNEPEAQSCSAWYHTNNLLSQVLFEETSRLIPSNAVLVEIAPHGLLQAILKRSLNKGCVNIPLAHRGHSDNIKLLLEAIGRLHMEGYNMKIKALYPKVECPVSTETPLLSHLVDWIHDERWKMSVSLGADRKISSNCNFAVAVHDDAYNYMQGHVVRGKILYPFAATLIAVWDTLAMTLGVPKKQLSVQFNSVHLFVQPMLHQHRPLEINIALQKGTGKFEVLDKCSKVASGYIKAITDKALPATPTDNVEIVEKLDLDAQDVYELLQERDYNYSGDFRSILKANTSFTKAELSWTNNWVTFMDGILQLNVLGQASDTVSYPSHISKIYIDVKVHESFGNRNIIPATVSKSHSQTRCGGVLLETVKFYDLPPLKPDTVALKTLKFIPRFKSNSIDLVSTFKVYIQIVAENVNNDVIKIVGLLDNNEYIFNSMKNLLLEVPKVKFEYKEINSIQNDRESLSTADVVVVKNLSAIVNTCQALQGVLQRGTFILNADDCNGTHVLPSSLFRVLCSDSAGRTRLELGRWRPERSETFSSVVFVQNPSDMAKLSITRDNLINEQKMLVVTSYPPVLGLKDLIKRWRQDSNRNKIYLVMTSGNTNIDQVPDLDLAFNVLDNNVWGGEYYISCKDRVAVERELTLQIARISDLDSLQWVEMSDVSESVIGVTVRYAGINDLDVKRATGVAPFKQDNNVNGGFGMDYSGTLDGGERVMGIVPGGAASGRVCALPDLLWPVPAHWSLEDAATVPSAYAQAFYCLGIRCDLYPGMTVLVHGGAGALGQATISIALANGCEVFTTVGDIRKKVFLRRLFPDLKEDHIGNSRDNSFGDMVMQATNGKGCDIVVSCVKGDLLNTTLNCASFCGITLDTAQLQSKDDFAYGMYYMTKQRSYIVVDFNSIFDCKEDLKDLHAMMTEGIARGYVRPLSRVTYAPSDVTRAFRLLAASRHRGRVLLRMRDSIVATQPRLTCSPDNCYLVICDTDGFGLQLASRLVSRGARKLRLHCSKVPTYIHLKILTWQKIGVRVEVSSHDLNGKEGALALIKDSLRMGPIDGVYVIMPNGSTDIKGGDYNTIVANLDFASRELCPSIRHFAVVTADDSIGHQTCLIRARNKLPATRLHLPIERNGNIMSSAKDAVSWRSALDAVESALHSSQPLLLAQPQVVSRPSLLQEIAAIADIKINGDVKGIDTLQSLGMDNSKAPAIWGYLQNTYNLAIVENQIPLLSIQKIQELEVSLTDTDFSEVNGLGSYFANIDSKVMLATNRLVFMPTIYQDFSRADEFDTRQKYLCIVPGLEGHYARFQSLCLRLKMPALVLQPGLDHMHETQRETAERYADTLLTKVGIKDNFYLLGYESGILTAFELATILEDKGLTGTVFCVGGTPEEIFITINKQLNNFGTEEELQNAVAIHMSNLIAQESIPDLEAKLKVAPTWQEKVDACIFAMRDRSSHSTQYTRLLIDAAYARIDLTRDYKVQPKALRSNIVIIRTTSTSRVSDTKAQYYSGQPVVSYDLATPLAHAPYDVRCAMFINRHLGADLLEAFDTKNLCQTYCSNVFEFTFRKAVKNTDDSV